MIIIIDSVLKKIYRKIKSYDVIVIARHVGPDPDAITSQIALRDSIRKTFPNKRVYAVGKGVARFKKFGSLDKIPEDENVLLITLDVPNMARIDGLENIKYKEIVKIDHHPKEDIPATIDWTDTSACSTCQMITELILKTKLVLDKDIASNLFLGIVSDSDRFLLYYTSSKTYFLVAKLIESTNLDFTPLYKNLYERPFNEIKFKAYITNNIKINDNGLAYIILNPEIFNEYGVDSSTASNMINDFNYINEILVWTFISYDTINNVYKVSIRSRGPIINTIASNYNGGGHIYASGARIKNEEDIPVFLNELNNACIKYNKENEIAEE